MEDFQFKQNRLGVPLTISTIAQELIKKYWSDKGYLGYQVSPEFKIGDASIVQTPKVLGQMGNIGENLSLYIANYKGGRNESFMYGRDRETIWYDYDLIGAYTTAMCLLGNPNYSKARLLKYDEFIQMDPLELLHSYIVLKVDFNFPRKVKIESSENDGKEDVLKDEKHDVFYNVEDMCMYPNIPVYGEKATVFYPSKGTAVITMAEYLVGLKNHCKFRVHAIYMLPLECNEASHYNNINTKKKIEVLKDFKNKSLNSYDIELGSILYKEYLSLDLDSEKLFIQASKTISESNTIEKKLDSFKTDPFKIFNSLEVEVSDLNSLAEGSAIKSKSKTEAIKYSAINSSSSVNSSDSAEVAAINYLALGSEDTFAKRSEDPVAINSLAMGSDKSSEKTKDTLSNNNSLAKGSLAKGSVDLIATELLIDTGSSDLESNDTLAINSLAKGSNSLDNIAINSLAMGSINSLAMGSNDTFDNKTVAMGSNDTFDNKAVDPVSNIDSISISISTLELESKALLFKSLNLLELSGLLSYDLKNSSDLDSIYRETMSKNYKAFDEDLIPFLLQGCKRELQNKKQILNFLKNLPDFYSKDINEVPIYKNFFVTCLKRVRFLETFISTGGSGFKHKTPIKLSKSCKINTLSLQPNNLGSKNYGKVFVNLPYQEVIKYLHEERSKCPKKTIGNELFKLIGNTGYGLIVKGIGNKLKFDTAFGTVQRMGVSELSNPVLASYITAFVRSLVSEMLNCIQRLGGKVVSVTTDGFITNLPDLESLLSQVIEKDALESLEVAENIIKEDPRIKPLDLTEALKYFSGVKDPRIFKNLNALQKKFKVYEYLISKYEDDRVDILLSKRTFKSVFEKEKARKSLRTPNRILYAKDYYQTKFSLICKTLSLVREYKLSRRFLNGDDTCLEIKSHGKDLFSWCVRGQLGVESDITAITGFQKKGLEKAMVVKTIEKGLKDYEKTVDFIHTSLRSGIDIYKKGGNVVRSFKDQKFRMMSDNRREFVDRRKGAFIGDLKTLKLENGTSLEYVSLEKVLVNSIPLKDKEQGISFRKVAELLKNNPQYNRLNPKISQNKYQSKLDIALRQFVRALLNKKLRLTYDFKSYKDLCDWLNTFKGIHINPNTVALIKNRAKYLNNQVIKTEESLEFVKFIKLRYPRFKEDKFFVVDHKGVMLENKKVLDMGSSSSSSSSNSSSSYSSSSSSSSSTFSSYSSSSSSSSSSTPSSSSSSSSYTNLLDSKEIKEVNEVKEVNSKFIFEGLEMEEDELMLDGDRDRDRDFDLDKDLLDKGLLKDPLEDCIDSDFNDFETE